MENEQVDIFLQYLQRETNYAVILNGPYGTGKTYFFNKVLSPKIETLSIGGESSEKYRPIHISLFGISSVDEISKLLYLELHPLIATKVVQFTGGIFKAITRGFAGAFTGQEIEKFWKDIPIDSTKNQNLKQIVICFDDLDRINDKLSLNEVFGFINTLTENQGIKILIIANEEVVTKNKANASWEKVIGVSIYYQPDPIETFYSIIANRKYDPAYSDFLKKNSNFIVGLLKNDNNNFRNLVFFIECFKLIHESLGELFKADEILTELESKKILSILHFSLAISIEIKNNRLNSTNLEQFSDLIEVSNAHKQIKFARSLSENELSGKNYLDQFLNRYYPRELPYIYNSILNYFLGIKSFRIQALEAELITYFPQPKDKDVPDEIRTLNELDPKFFIRLSDTRYRQLTNKMLAYANNGKYHLSYYPKIFLYAIRLNNLLGYNISKLTRKLKLGIERSTSGELFDPNFQILRVYFAFENYYSEELKELEQFCIEANHNLRKLEIEEKIKNINKLLWSDFDAFLNLDEVTDDIISIPIWKRISAYKFAMKIRTMHPYQIQNLETHFQQRYRKGSLREFNYFEKDFIENLIQQIERPIRGRNKHTIRNRMLDSLLSQLKSSALLLK